MIGLRNFLAAIVGWIDRKFPDKMTTSEVEVKLKALEARIEVLEKFVPQIRVDIAKVKLLSGLEQLTGVSE